MQAAQNMTALPPRRSVFDHRPASARRRVLDAARVLLRSQGYDRFTMEAVAMRSGLSRRTIYNQFEDRDALYRASRMELLECFEALLPLELASETELTRGMERFFAAALAAMALPEHRELHDSVMRDGAASPWLRQLYASRVERPLRLAVEHFLLMQSARGAVEIGDPGPPAHRALAMLKAALSSPEGAPVFEARELASVFVQRLPATPR